MGMPLANEAYSIVNKSLETGARGSSTKVTDYSGISDAFMKKASLETQIGGMLMDQNMNRANLLSNIDMHKADLYMQSADMALRESQFQRQMQAQKDADKMSPFEQITGVLAGAAAPAAAGFAIGGPVGAVVGGVAGGAMTLGAGNSRTRQQNIIGNIGAISQGAMAIKGLSNQSKAQDSSNELLKSVNSISGIFRSAAPNSEEFQGAQAQLDNYVSKYTNDQIKAGRPMGEVYKEAAAIKKEAMQGFDPNDQQMVASRNMRGLVAAAKSDPVFMDPSAPGHRQRVKQFQSEMGAEYTNGWGKSATAPMVQQWTGQVDAGVAEKYFSGKSLTAMPSGGGNMSSQRPSGGTQMQLNPADGTSTMQANRGTPDQGIATENYVVPSAAPNVSPVSNAYGLDMDHGTESMLQSAQTNFAQAAAKDPSIVATALHQDSPAQQDGDTEGETQDHKNRVSISRKIGELLPGKDNFEQYADGQQKPATQNQEAPAAKREYVQIKPELTSQNPETQRKEQVFKTATDPEQIINEFGLKGRYADKATSDAVNGPLQATVGMNRMREYINRPDVQEAIASMTPEQKKLWDNYVRGLGEDAMKGSSLGATGSAAGVSAQVNWSKFERSINVSNEGKGDHHGLTKAQLSTMSQLKAMMTPVSRTIAMGLNTGTLTDADVAWVPESMLNMFDSDVGTATAGFNSIHNVTWDTFNIKYNTYQSAGDKEDSKMRTRAPQKQQANKPYVFF